MGLHTQLKHLLKTADSTQPKKKPQRRRFSGSLKKKAARNNLRLMKDVLWSPPVGGGEVLGAGAAGGLWQSCSQSLVTY